MRLWGLHKKDFKVINLKHTIVFKWIYTKCMIG